MTIERWSSRGEAEKHGARNRGVPASAGLSPFKRQKVSPCSRGIELDVCLTTNAPFSIVYGLAAVGDVVGGTPSKIVHVSFNRCRPGRIERGAASTFVNGTRISEIQEGACCFKAALSKHTSFKAK